MPHSDDDTPRARRERRSSARQGHAKSPNRKLDFVSDEAYEIDEGEKSVNSGTRRTSLANFSATKLMETLKDSSSTPLARLQRRPADGEGEATAPPPPAPASSMTPTSTTRSGRRTPARTMSAQGARTSSRRMRSENTDMLSQSMIDDSYNGHGNEMDSSHISSQSQSRRRLPQRTRSAQDSCLPRGHPPPTQRGPRPRRRPDREDGLGEESEIGMSSRRRGGGVGRSRSSHEQTRGAARTPRSARRRRAASTSESDDSDDSGSVVISDSDESDNPRSNNSRYNDDIDESTASATSRRRRPQRAMSTDSGIPTARGGAGRQARASRRRPSTGDGSPNRRGPSIGPSPGLMRSNTANNPTRGGGRVRGGRDTARELAQVTANREKSPDPSLASAEDNKHSVSPIKTRQERRRLREGKEREGLERHMQQAEEEEEELLPEKKEALWKRRLKKSGGAKTNDDSFSIDDGGGSGRHDGLTNHDSGGTRNTLGSAGTKEFFPVDPTFGVFAAEPLKNAHSSMDDDDDGDDADPFSSMISADTKNKKKLDFSSIS